MKNQLVIILSTTALLSTSAAFAGKPGGACTNKVKATTFSMAPMPAAAGGTETLSGGIQNLTKGSLSVAWQITDETGAVVASGTATVAAGQTASVTGTWTAVAGAHTLTFTADPKNTLGEAGTCLSDNTKASAVTVA